MLLALGVCCVLVTLQNAWEGGDGCAYAFIQLRVRGSNALEWAAKMEHGLVCVQLDEEAPSGTSTDNKHTVKF